VSNLHLTNNLTFHNEYGIIGDEVGVGNAAIAAYTTGVNIRRNVLAGGNASLYPPDNFFPGTEELLNEFMDSGQHDYRLKSGSRFRTAATDGSMIGADVDAILRGNTVRRAIPRPPR
jgi:hypothetical protein